MAVVVIIRLVLVYYLEKGSKSDVSRSSNRTCTTSISKSTAISCMYPTIIATTTTTTTISYHSVSSMFSLASFVCFASVFRRTERSHSKLPAQEQQ